MNPCIHCKGRHSETSCPLYIKSLQLSKFKHQTFQKDFVGSSPAPFVGHYGYPEVNVGILTPPDITEDAWRYDAPKFWASENYGISDVAELRSSLVNSRFVINVKKTNNFAEIARLVGMSSKPVDVDIELKDSPVLRLNVDSHSAPTGPAAKLEQIQLTSNPSISRKVESVVNDELKAQEAVTLLYDKGFDENFLMRMLSVGTLGEKRKFVPTRWSITATDDMLGKHLIDEIRDFPVGDYAAYFGSYLGNYYLLLFFPHTWNYELFETYLPGSKEQFSTDFESFYGRKDYAESTAGGYYTVRLAIAEKLKERKRQGSVLALRFISDEYTLPLGVWVTKEATRKSLSNKPLKFSSQELMLTYARHFVKRKFGYDLDFLLKKSILLNQLLKQKSISDFA